MRVQLGFIASVFVGAMIAVPFLYEHRMNDLVFMAGLLAFIGAPFVAGLLQRQTHRPVTLVVVGLLLFCPIVYAVTDELATEYEKLRDDYFLGVSSTAIFVATSWLIGCYKLGNRVRAVGAGFLLVLAALAVYAQLWMVVYFE